MRDSIQRPVSDGISWRRICKIKTHRSTSKRFRRTKGGKGKLMRTRQGQSHFHRKKSKRAKREFGQMVPVESNGVRERVRRLAPYMNEERS
jgi:large subunit ribosomal protein L35